MYTYETTGNGLTLEILGNGKSVFFAQDEEAGKILSRLDKAKTNEREQGILRYAVRKQRQSKKKFLRYDD